MKSFDYQFKGMRKPQNFVVYPALPTDKELSIQSGSTFARFDRVTGEGRINRRGSNYKTSLHLMSRFGGEEFVCPKECMELAENTLKKERVFESVSGGACVVL